MKLDGNDDDLVFSDDEFIERFENCTFPPDRFHHKEHIRLTWLYLGKYEAIAALDRVSNGIKKFAAALGKVRLYHETITWAYVFLTHERMARAPLDQSWEQFASDNADLFEWKESILKRYYREDTIGSDLAKKVFVMPDRIP